MPSWPDAAQHAVCYPGLSQNVDLAFGSPQVYANMLHGWPPSHGIERVDAPLGQTATTLSGWPAASFHLPLACDSWTVTAGIRAGASRQGFSTGSHFP